MSYKMERKGRYTGKVGMQYKYFGLQLKKEDFDEKSRTISGYAAVFGNRDKAGDVLVKGCFSKSIRERGPESQANDKILLLWMHDMSEPIGKVMKLEEDERGLYFEAKIDEIELGDRAIKQLESGTLNQFSIGYSYVWENCEWEDDTNTLYVKEVKLYELSVVSIGCNAETEYLGRSVCQAGQRSEPAVFDTEHRKATEDNDNIGQGNVTCRQQAGRRENHSTWQAGSRRRRQARE